MILTEKQLTDFKLAAAPLMKFMSDEFHPHVTAIVSSTQAELIESVALIHTLEFIHD